MFGCFFSLMGLKSWSMFCLERCRKRTRRKTLVVSNVVAVAMAQLFPRVLLRVSNTSTHDDEVIQL